VATNKQALSKTLNHFLKKMRHTVKLALSAFRSQIPATVSAHCCVSSHQTEDQATTFV